jgi:hypothetical protein
MQQEGIIDAAVIVSRWHGGTMLGPAQFARIETYAQEVCRAFKRKEELKDSITTSVMTMLERWVGGGGAIWGGGGGVEGPSVAETGLLDFPKTRAQRRTVPFRMARSVHWTKHYAE